MMLVIANSFLSEAICWRLLRHQKEIPRNDMEFKNMKYIIITLFIFLISCDNISQPSQKEVSKLYIDVLFAEEMYKTDIDSMKIAVDSLYEFHDITKETYISSLTKYKTNEETWNAFFDLATVYLDTLQAIERKK